MVLKRKQEKLYVALDFKNNLIVDALAESRVYVIAIAQNDLDAMKQRAPKIIIKNGDHPIFWIQVAEGRLQKLVATTTLEFEIGGNIFAKQLVILKK